MVSMNVIVIVIIVLSLVDTNAIQILILIQNKYNTNINKRAKGESAECISWVLCFLCQRLPQSLHLLDIIVIMFYPHQGRYSLKLVLFTLLYILKQYLWQKHTTLRYVVPLAMSFILGILYFIAQYTSKCKS